MKRHAELSAPLGGLLWEGGASTFIHKGVNGRWRDVLSAEESRRYETLAVEQLGEDCAHWLKTGESEAGWRRRPDRRRLEPIRLSWLEASGSREIVTPAKAGVQTNKRVLVLGLDTGLRRYDESGSPHEDGL